MTNVQPSSRQIRYDRTWHAIHDAAYELVSAKGMRATTVDEIAEKACISPRTFFNYFPTKDDAVLGLRAPKLTDEMLERDRQRQDRYIFVRVALLMLEVLESSTSKRTYEVLRALLPSHPELKSRVKHLQMDAEKIISDFLLSIDWDAFSAKGRRGEFIFLQEDREHSEETKNKVRASVYASYSVLRYIAVDGAIPPVEEREEKIEAAVKMLKQLLRED